MSASVVFTGSIIAGPQGSGDCGFPSSIVNTSFGTIPSQLPSAVLVSHSRQVNSPSAFVALDGVGVASTVTQGNFLYVKANAAILLRLTMFGNSGPIVSVLPLQGPLVMEFPASNYLYLLEAQGVGGVEYLVSGNQ